MTSPSDPAIPALARLSALEQRTPAAPRMGYQPGLDGIRAVSVIAVILYHAGFSWMHGGFFGVEVFFVVSGFLITSLLLDERERDGSVSLGQFWVRRARRLLPALFTMLLAVTLWASFFGEEHLAQLKADILPAIFYVSNWAQILGDVPYFASADPPLLRHLWSLAVEEQWYLIWPLVFVALVSVLGRRGSRVPLVLIGASLAAMTFSVLLTFSDDPSMTFLGQDVERYNFLYLNTISRSSGLLLGAAFAFFWRPWRWSRAARAERRGLDIAGLGAMVLVIVISMTRSVDILSSASLYRLWLPLVTILSMVAVAMVVHPGARVTRAVFSSAPLVEIGKRSYGLYLWHWPVFVFADVAAHRVRFIPAMLVAIVLSELCYRFVETPVRTGALGRWWARLGEEMGPRRSTVGATWAFALGVLVLALGGRLATSERVDVARDDSEVAFDASVVTGAVTTTPGAPADPASTVDPTASDPSVSDPAAVDSAPVPTQPATTTTLATLPRRLVIVGDSQAHSLAINLPDGIESTFTVTDGSVEGCGVLTDGTIRSQRTSFRRSLTDCSGFADEWAQAAASGGAEVALVVLGAWEVFDVEVDGALVPFASAQADQRILDGLQAGIDALRAQGTHVALLEIACMRPQDVQGAGVPALPERGDDARIAHLNALLLQAVERNPEGVSFVSGPTAWCNDESISSNLCYRWDGVHVYKPGAKLIMETIAPALVSIPV